MNKTTHNSQQNQTILVDDDCSYLLELAVYAAASGFTVCYCNQSLPPMATDKWQKLIRQISEHLAIDQTINLEITLSLLKINLVNYAAGGAENTTLENKITQVKQSLGDNSQLILVVTNSEEETTYADKLIASLGESCPILTTNQQQLNLWRENSNLAKMICLGNFYHPTLARQLVEIDQGLQSSQLFDQARSILIKCGYQIFASSASSALIIERMHGVFFAEGWRVFAEHAASAKVLDFACRQIAGFTLGLFQLSDLLRCQEIFLDNENSQKPFVLARQSNLLTNTNYSKNLYHGIYDLNQGEENVQFLKSDLSVDKISWYGSAASVLAPIYQRFSACSREILLLNAEDAEQLSLNTSCFLFDNAKVYLSDGRTATERAVDEDTPNVILIDLALDFQQCKYLLITKADSCSEQALAKAVSAFALIGVQCLYIDDIAGMLILRIIAQLINEQGFILTEHLARAEDLEETLLKACTLQISLHSWIKRYGYVLIAQVLQNLQEHCSSERYRLSPMVRRQALKAYW